MWLVKGAPNLMQRLTRLPPAPNVTLLDRRKPKSLSWPHANTTFTLQTYIRWCCIDLSNAPRLPDKLTQALAKGWCFSLKVCKDGRRIRHNRQHLLARIHAGRHWYPLAVRKT